MLANLKAALATRKIHQVDLEISLKISPSILSEVINERREADRDLRRQISETLNTDDAWLFTSVVPKRRRGQREDS